jgi:hypothetical protein
VNASHIAKRLAVLAMDPDHIEITRHTTKSIIEAHPEVFKNLGLDVIEQIELLSAQKRNGESNEDVYRAAN